ncbi:MAG: GNAT family N-acetyltransferase [Planctomycetota bacterium]
MPTFPHHDLHFETDRLLLRPCVLADFDVATEWYRDPVFRMLMDPNPQYEITREYLENIGRGMAKSGWLFTLVLRSTDRPIGEACLQWMNVERAEVRPDEKVMRMPMGIWDRSLWRQGYGREAAVVLRDHAFRARKIDRLCAMMVSRDNPASRGLFTSIGMRIAREVPERDEVDLEITRAEWTRLVGEV